jgi:hypothetical protein
MCGFPLYLAGWDAQVDAEGAQRMLKDLVFENWIADGCEDRIDTVKMVTNHLPLAPYHWLLTTGLLPLAPYHWLPIAHARKVISISIGLVPDTVSMAQSRNRMKRIL